MRRHELERLLLAEVEKSRAAYLELRSRFQCASSACSCCPEADHAFPIGPSSCALAEARDRYRDALGAFTRFVLDGILPSSLTG